MENQERSIQYAMLHAPLFVPGLGQFGPTLDTKDQTKNKVSSMTLKGTFLSVMSKGVEVLLPLTSVSHMVPTK